MALKEVATDRFLKVRDTAVTWMGTWGSLQEYGDSPLGKSLQSTCAVDLGRLPKKKGTLHCQQVWGESCEGGSFGQGSAGSVIRAWRMGRSPSLVPWEVGKQQRTSKSKELGWILRSGTGGIQSGAVRRAGLRVKQACTSPVCITPLPSEGLGKAPPDCPGCGDTQPLRGKKMVRSLTPSTPRLRLQRRGLGVGMGQDRGCVRARSCSPLPGGGQGAPALQHWEVEA